ncbi:outer membrane beta-barrel protein [Candidatus Methylacidithermus pantelleriae]|uniref:Porin n=1 Tax=Candidatus Methylacidithermus pantelleriae TaxID=2744239 RepID=A0A8J2FRQ1_9BACT|nr:outer membrane beta-barrel protein [Candidatus Methylacidithermus pantelleriae]CAF0689689.1 conserved hypothetical protein [Candidatus Methylacidithermus pantelleriae]
MRRFIDSFFVCFALCIALVAWEEGSRVFGEDSSSSATSSDSKETKKVEELKKMIEDQGIYVETSQKGIVLSGYVDASYTYNFLRADSDVPSTSAIIPTREPPDSIPGGGFNLNAVKLALEKPLGDKNDWVAGFRVDLLFGQDASISEPDFLQSKGVPFGSGVDTSGLLVEQGYVQFRVPVGNGLDFKVGKFAAPIGYEVIERPANMNFTYGNIFTNLLPTTLVGLQSTYKFSDQWSAMLGIADSGFNSSRGGINFNNMIDNNDAYLLLSSVTWTAPGKNANIIGTVFYGFNGANNPGFPAGGTFGRTLFTENGQFLIGDLVASWTPKFANDKLLLAAEFNEGFFDPSVGANGSPFQIPSDWRGASIWAKYQFTKVVSLAMRGDWVESAGSSFPFPPGFASFPGIGDVATSSFFAGHSDRTDIWSYTATLRFDLWQNMMLRLEYRLDWGRDLYGNAAQFPLGFPQTGASHGPAHLAAFDVAYSF